MIARLRALVSSEKAARLATIVNTVHETIKILLVKLLNIIKLLLSLTIGI